MTFRPKTSILINLWLLDFNWDFLQWILIIPLAPRFLDYPWERWSFEQPSTWESINLNDYFSLPCGNLWEPILDQCMYSDFEDNSPFFTVKKERDDPSNIVINTTMILFLIKFYTILDWNLLLLGFLESMQCDWKAETKSDLCPVSPGTYWKKLKLTL